MKQYKKEFIEFLIRTKALKFGEFTLKSGRLSPYFINTGCFDDGAKVSKLGYYYASLISDITKDFDVLFGPSYKGIPLALSTSISLEKDHSMNAGYAFDRKEAKDHGDKGVVVGKKLEDGNTAIIIDDVITSGRSIRESFDVLRAQADVNVLAVVISVDRMEKGKTDKSAIKELEEEFGVKVLPIATIREIIEYLHNKEIDGVVYIDDVRKAAMEKYLEQYGVPQMEAKEKIIAALDVDSFEKAKSLIEKLSTKVGAFKIGKQLFTKEGPAIVKYVKSNGGKVFLDLKYHDIPNTVAMAGCAAADLGVLMFNIHCSGGLEMMRTCAGKVTAYCSEKNLKKPLIIGVTVLTSIDDDILSKELKVNEPLKDYAVYLAKLARIAGLDGVVCSPREAGIIKAACGSDFLTVTPGVRPAWSVKDDQKRITTPKQAVENGADYLVIGRAITNQEDPVDAAEKIAKEMEE